MSSPRTPPLTLTSKSRIGWIGTGVMGRSMCGHLLTKGYDVTVYSRTKARAETLLEQGAVWADSPRAVAERSEVICSIVGFPPDVRQVYLGDQGIVAAVAPGAVIIDMTTTEPRLSRDIYDAVAARDAWAIDAPLSGGDVGARNATLSIMIGGDRPAIDAVMPLFETIGKSIVHQGGPGAGQHAKMCNQIVIAGTMIGVCESLLYGCRAGLDLETMLSSIRGGAAGCWTLDNLAPRVLKGNFDPGFMVEHFIKDMGIALDEARHMGLSLPGLALVHQLYLAVQAQGHGQRGTHALMLALERLSNVSRA